jgi:Zn-dependent peptidase ImmA (M78 family)
VISWTDAHQRAAVLASQVHADLNIDLTEPVDVFTAAEELGLVLAFTDLGPTSGIYIPGGRSSGILIHSGHPRTRQRYTAGHELGHHVFGHALERDVDLEGELRRDYQGFPDHEKEAEAFGAWFLMPRRLMRMGLSQLGIEKVASPFDIYSLSLWLGTSYSATARQLGTTRLITRAQAAEWARIPPKSLKAALAGRHVPDDLRNDVWWLDAEMGVRHIEARPGDRLVVTAAEVPSSGHTWRVSGPLEQLALIADSFDENILSLDPMADADPEVAGGHSRHAFVFEVRGDSDHASTELDLVLDQPWSPEPVSDRLTLTVSVNLRLHGIQVPENEFRVAS